MKDPGSSNRPDTTMDYRNRINQAMRYMRAHSGQQLCIAAIAAQAHFSPFHFHRIFSAFTGETVGEYITRIRMAKAAKLLEDGCSVADAGAAVGYQTTSAFIKVFRKAFGMLPARRPGREKLHYPPGPAKTRRPAGMLQAAIRELPNLPLLYVSKKGVENEFFNAGATFDLLYDYLNQHGLTGHVKMRLGVLRDMELLDTAQWRFDACIVLPEALEHVPVKPMERCLINAGKWAVFLHKGPYDTLWQTWSQAYRTWLPYSNMQLRDVPPFEVYLNSRKNTPPAELLTEIHLPIQELIINNE
ncbi:MAG TPA: AraC family transcriptional regulator [Chitinophaga sp.]|uniref:AraC family transcriptional regulator n=1 Tax=Chitinophaga sp. TaxID=1869181 RepID=UPI002F932830